MDKPKPLECAQCGNITLGRQWWNQDKGYGLCNRCANEEKSCPIASEAIPHNYGKEGKHYLLTEEL